MLRLVITRAGDAFREEREFDEPDLVAIGRGETNDVVLEDASTIVSRYHAAIVRLPAPEKGYFVRDLSSRNGTRVGGKVVCRKRLAHGDVIEVGGYRLGCSFHRELGRGAARDDLPLVVDESKALSLAGERTEADQPTQLVAAPEDHAGSSGGRLRAEALEEMLRRAQKVSEAREFYQGAMDPLLRAVDADRGFVALFSQGACQCVARRLGPNERIRIADGSYQDALRKGQYVQEGRVLLVPLFGEADPVGFVCVSRRPPKPAFALDEAEFLEVLGRKVMALLAERSEGTTDEGWAWGIEWVGNSRQMREVAARIEELAGGDHTVLVTGETGTGKELVATAVHRRSPWVRGPLIKVNCATISEDVPGLVLFGYPPNPALGQADRAGRAGLIEQAHRGTLFLDEIQTMGLKVQPQLLRVLEEKRVRRIGADRETEVEVRFVVATNEDLHAKVRAGEFRADLYERLRRRTLVLPPLRARPEDIPLLVHYFLDREPGSPRWVSRQVLEELMRHDWPGNVRELEHCLSRAKSQDKEVIFSWDLGLEEGRHSSPEPAVAQPAAPARAEPRRQPRPITEVEKEAIQETLEWTRGNKAQAARLLGWTWQTLDSKMKRYGVA